MNMQTRDTPAADDAAQGQTLEARFDAAMRERYRDAAAHVSPHVRWRLRPDAAVASRRPAVTRVRVDWRVGAAFAGVAAAVFALAIGLNLRPDLRDTAPEGSPASAVASVDAENQSPLLTTSLDEDPDFYAWLASDDADLVAME